MPEWFAIATFESAGRTGTGLVLGDQLYVAPLAGDATALIAQWVEAQASLAALADQMSRGPQKPLEKGSYKLLAPYRPGRIFGAASNYYEHAREMGTKLAERKESAPYVFMKAETSVIGPGDTVRIPAPSSVDQVILRVQFRTDSATLLAISGPVLDTVAAAIRETPGSRWQVEGHTDNTGSAAENKALALARAQSVVDYLVSKGVDRSILTAQGFGPDRPVFSNSTDAGRAQNRRVQLRRIPPPPTTRVP